MPNKAALRFVLGATCLLLVLVTVVFHRWQMETACHRPPGCVNVGDSTTLTLSG